VGNIQVKVLPDYRPKLKKYDPSVEMDPPNPHESILHDQNDLTILVGVHCYRTDFVIRLLRKHTPTKGGCPLWSLWTPRSPPIHKLYRRRKIV
jgi:lipoate-protein ligase A